MFSHFEVKSFPHNSVGHRGKKYVSSSMNIRLPHDSVGDHDKYFFPGLKGSSLEVFPVIW